MLRECAMSENAAAQYTTAIRIECHDLRQTYENSEREEPDRPRHIDEEDLVEYSDEFLLIVLYRAVERRPHGCLLLLSVIIHSAMSVRNDRMQKSGAREGEQTRTSNDRHEAGVSTHAAMLAHVSCAHIGLLYWAT